METWGDVPTHELAHSPLIIGHWPSAGILINHETDIRRKVQVHLRRAAQIHPPKSQQVKVGLLSLPAELRNLIYHHCLKEDAPIEIEFDSRLPPLMAANMKILTESMGIYLSANTFAIRGPEHLKSLEKAFGTDMVSRHVTGLCTYTRTDAWLSCNGLDLFPPYSQRLIRVDLSLRRNETTPSIEIRHEFCEQHLHGQRALSLRDAFAFLGPHPARFCVQPFMDQIVRLCRTSGKHLDLFQVMRTYLARIEDITHEEFVHHALGYPHYPHYRHPQATEKLPPACWKSLVYPVSIPTEGGDDGRCSKANC